MIESPPQAPGTALPRPRSPLIGRDREVADIGALLLREDVPLVTVTGPGGAGKTRLALAVARDVAGSFRDGAWLIPLAPVRRAELVPSALAQALGLREAAEVPPVELVRRFLTNREALLVLDNVEHVVDAAWLVASVVESCPGVTVLATSRTRLRLTDEREYPLSPLSMPEGGAATVDAAAESDAVRLFVERAQAVSPRFVLDAGNAASVAEICRRLDGQPLAIELAAARVKALSPAALLDRLERSLSLLVDGRRDAPARQRTLRDAIAWSYDLLSDPERAVLRRLATFVGGFSIEAAEAVCADLDADPLTVVSSLVDQSLVQPIDPTGSGGVARPVEAPTHRLLETVREFGLEELTAAGEVEIAGRLHADYFIALAERVGPVGWDYGSWAVQATDVHLGNWRAVLDRARRADDRALACRLANALMGYWAIRCHIVEGRSWLAWILEAPDLPTDERALAELGHGLLSFIHGDYAVAAAGLDRAAVHFRERDDTAQLFRALMWSGEVALFSGDARRAGDLFAECLQIARTGGARAEAGGWAAWPLKNLSFLATRDGDLERAAALLEESLAVARATGHAWGTASALSELGTLARRGGRPAEAAARVIEALELLHWIGDVAGVGFALGDVALLSAERGGGERAAELAGAAEGHLARVGREAWPLTAGEMDRALGRVRAELGDTAFDAAVDRGRRSPLAEAVALAREEAERLARTGEPRDDEGAPRTPDGRMAGLSAREVEVIRLLAAGLSDQEIADALYVSRRTASTHVSNILTKLTLANRAEAAVWAVRRGLA